MIGDPGEVATSARIRSTVGTESRSTNALRVTKRMPGGGVAPSTRVSA